ncbi:MAG: hypothetical protein AMXMBFR34_28640 [Myxococcaceae bacterium]
MKLSPEEAAPYLAQLASLVTVARPGALFPPPRPVLDLLAFLGRSRPRAGPPVVELHRASGLPVGRLLARLLAHQQAVRAFLASHRAKATRASSSYHVALAATELPPVSRTTARLMGREGKRSRLLVVHDATRPDGLWLRLTVQVTQAGNRPLPLDRQDQATVPEPLARALADVAANAALSAAWPALERAAGVTVHEVERGVLGPFVSSAVTRLPRGPAEDQAAAPPGRPPGSSSPPPAQPAQAAARGLAPQQPGAVGGAPSVLSLADALGGALEPGGGVLSLVLERAGESVRAARCVDLWGHLPVLPEPLLHRGVRAFRERRLICSPGLEAQVRVVAPGCLVRAR